MTEYMRRDKVVTIRVNELEDQFIVELSKEMGVSKAEVWRRLLWTIRILFSSYLPAKKALLKIMDEKASLGDVLKPIPELFKIFLEEATRESP